MLNACNLAALSLLATLSLTVSPSPISRVESGHFNGGGSESLVGGEQEARPEVPNDIVLLSKTINVRDNPAKSENFPGKRGENFGELVDNYLANSLAHDIALEGSVLPSNQLETLSQMTQFDDQISQQQLHQQHQYQQQLPSNQLMSSGYQNSNSQLGPEFLSLFDELWRVKNTSVAALVRLNYFTPGMKFNSTQQAASMTMAPTTNQYGANKTSATCSGPKCRITGPIGNLISPLPVTTASPPLRPPPPPLSPPTKLQRPVLFNPLFTNPNLKIQPQANIGHRIKSGWNELTNRINGWFSQCRQRVDDLMIRLTSPLLNKFNKQTGSGGGQRTSVLNQMDDDDADDRPSEPSGIAEPKSLVQEASSPRDDISTTRVRRQTSEDFEVGRLLSRQLNVGERCIDPDVNTINNCLHHEKVMTEKLSQSFPGNLAAIEDNCRTISFLLGNCWPEHLHYIRIVLASWDESVLKTTDFPLPIPPTTAGTGGSMLGQQQQQQLNDRSPYNNNRPTELQPCGVSSNVSAAIIERMNWMWLNLCLDKKFRTDYIENVSCLAKWPNEKAQSSCQTEHRQMQAQMNLYMTNANQYLTSASTGGSGSINKGRPLAKRQVTFDMARDQQQRLLPGTSSLNAKTIATTEIPLTVNETSVAKTTNPPLQINLTTSSLMSRSLPSTSSYDPTLERELSSKALCCVYDLYLRCVYKWAHKDCSKSGAQFVVNFMSRMGTDDMKYLCNNEPPTSYTPTPVNLIGTQQQQQFKVNKAPGYGGITGGSSSTLR